MPTPLAVIKRRVSHLLNALKADDFQSAIANYVPDPKVENYNSPMWPPGAIDDAIIDAQSDFIWAICNVAGHPWRDLYKSQTDPIAHGALVPAYDRNAVNIIGPYGPAFDALTREPVEPIAVNRIRRTRRANYHILPSFYYAIHDGRMYHTREGVILDCCVHDRRLVSNDCSSIAGSMSIPDVLADALVAKAVQSLVMKEELYPALSQAMGAIVVDAMNAIRGGLTTVEGKAQLPPLTVPQ
jgi:hypothetical protein